MTLRLRRANAADAPVLGEICYRAFKSIAEAHGFPPDFPSPEVGAAVVGSLIADPHVYDIVAEDDGVLVGSNFLAEQNPISGVGPITVDPALQDDGAGRAMMAAVMQRSQERGFAGIRLTQAGYHNRSLALYLKLGFEAREHLACVQGPAIGQGVSGRAVRAATREDLAACDRLCRRIHGHDRGGELAEAIGRGQARVVEHAGRLTGYTAGVAFFNHSVGEANDDLKALIGAASAFGGPGFLVPTRNGELMRWCLEHGLQVTQTMTLMSMGLYNQPEGAWLPSVIY